MSHPANVATEEICFYSKNVRIRFFTSLTITFHFYENIYMIFFFKIFKHSFSSNLIFTTFFLCTNHPNAKAPARSLITTYYGKSYQRQRIWICIRGSTLVFVRCEMREEKLREDAIHPLCTTELWSFEGLPHSFG